MNPQLPIFDIPPHVHQGTSYEAALMVRAEVSELRIKVLDFLEEHGPATDEEMQRGIPMAANTQRPRRRELVLKGLVIDSEERRKTRSGCNAIVWKIASAAQR